MKEIKYGGRGMRVLHIITRLDRGGSSDMVLALIKKLLQYGFDVELVTGLTPEGCERAEKFSRMYPSRITFIKGLTREIEPLHELAALLRIIKYIQRRGPFHIIHTHTSKAGALGRVAAFLNNIYEKVSGRDGSLIVHTPHGHIFYGYYGKMISRVIALVEKVLACFTDKITALTEREVEEHLEFRVGSREKFRVIPCGVEEGFFEAATGDERKKRKKELGFDENAPVIGTVARFVEVKDLPLLIEAASLLKKHIPELKLVLAGDGPLRPELERMVMERGLTGSTIFTGWLENPRDILAMLDLFLLTSRNEGFGRSLVEAMLVGAVPVAVNVGGVSEVVRDGVTGRVVSRDAWSLARAALELINSRTLLENFREAARKECLEKFTFRRTVLDCISLYRELARV